MKTIRAGLCIRPDALEKHFMEIIKYQELTEGFVRPFVNFYTFAV